MGSWIRVFSHKAVRELSLYLLFPLSHELDGDDIMDTSPRSRYFILLQYCRARTWHMDGRRILI